MSQFSKKLGKISVVVSFAIVLLMLALWVFVDSLADKFNYKMVVGAIVSALLGGFLYFDDKISNLHGGGRTNISFVSLSEAFIIAKRLHNVKRIRIYAVSSYRILALFSSNNIQAEICNVLVRGFADAELLQPENRDMEREIQQMIGEWRTQQRIGNIKNLKLSRYNFLPTEYHVIFDDRLLITGLYTPNKEADSKVDVEDPLLIDNATTDGEQIIKRYILRFDSFENDVNAS